MHVRAAGVRVCEWVEGGGGCDVWGQGAGRWARLSKRAGRQGAGVGGRACVCRRMCGRWWLLQSQGAPSSGMARVLHVKPTTPPVRRNVQLQPGYHVPPLPAPSAPHTSPKPRPTTPPMPALARPPPPPPRPQTPTQGHCAAPLAPRTAPRAPTCGSDSLNWSAPKADTLGLMPPVPSATTLSDAMRMLYCHQLASSCRPQQARTGAYFICIFELYGKVQRVRGPGW